MADRADNGLLLRAIGAFVKPLDHQKNHEKDGKKPNELPNTLPKTPIPFHIWGSLQFNVYNEHAYRERKYTRGAIMEGSESETNL